MTNSLHLSPSEVKKLNDKLFDLSKSPLDRAKNTDRLAKLLIHRHGYSAKEYKVDIDNEIIVPREKPEVETTTT